MLLPTRVTNRRQFLERTALGAGSVLFLPGLLTSCADHRIPDPNAPGTPGVTPPVIVGDSEDWNDDAKNVIVGLLGAIPEVGGILSGLTSIFWPGTDIWSQVKDRVNASIDQKLTDLEFKTAQGELNGLHGQITQFLEDVHTDSKDSLAAISGLYDTMQLNFVGAIHSFTTSGFEAALLPLFAQFANLHLSFLRDAVLAGKSWGRTDGQQAQDIKDLQTSIFNYINYAEGKYEDHQDYLSKNVGRDDPSIEPYSSQLRFNREITLMVLDYTKMWPFFDASKYPNKVKVSFPREVYSDPEGSFGQPDSTSISLLNTLQPYYGPTSLTVWGSTDGIQSIQLSYPAYQGPNSVTTTPQMGTQNNQEGTTDQPYGLILPISPNNPIVQARTSTLSNLLLFKNTGMYAMELKLKDGTVINKVGGDNTGQWGPWVTIRDHYISSIYIHGGLVNINSNHLQLADCIVFGFEYINGGPTVTSRTLERLYVTNPRELSGADLAQVSPTNGAAAAVITDNLKATRQAYWAANKARANAPK